MIFRNYNIHGYESVGQYRDRYKVKLDNGVTIYLPVYKFQVYAQNFKPKTRPHHGRPIVVGEKGKKKRKDEIIAWKKIRKDLRVHLEEEEDKKRADRERYERYSHLGTNVDEKKLVAPHGFLACPLIKHKRALVTVDGNNVTDTFGVGWDIFKEDKWADLQYYLEIDAQETTTNLVEFCTYPDPCANVKDIEDPYTFLTDRPVKDVTWMDFQSSGEYSWPSKHVRMLWGFVMKGETQPYTVRNKAGQGSSRSKQEGMPPVEFFMG